MFEKVKSKLQYLKPGLKLDTKRTNGSLWAIQKNNLLFTAKG